MLQMFSETDYYRTKKLLELANTCFYTYTPKKDKLVSILLKGLHYSYNPQDILKELQTFDTEGLKFIKVTHFTTKKSVSENIPLSIFLVQLDTNCQFQKLQKVNRLCHHVISWEKLKRKDIIQCKRCQRLGHVASNCNMRYKCVKCNDQHDPGNCKFSTTSTVSKDKIYCVNCKNFGHPASYRGCPTLLELRKKANEKKLLIQEKRERKIKNLNTFVKKNISYAEALKDRSEKERIDLTSQKNISNNFPMPMTSNAQNLINHPNNSDLFKEFQNQILSIFQKQQEQLNNLNKIIENTENKINYVLNIIDTILPQND